MAKTMSWLSIFFIFALVGAFRLDLFAPPRNGQAFGKDVIRRVVADLRRLFDHDPHFLVGNGDVALGKSEEVAQDVMRGCDRAVLAFDDQVILRRVDLDLREPLDETQVGVVHSERDDRVDMGRSRNLYFHLSSQW
jgi:hypothetical protein